MYRDFHKQKNEFITMQSTLFSVVKRYISGHIVEFDLFLLIAIALFLLSKLPYFNIILEKYFVSFILTICSVYIFRIQKRVVLVFTLGLFVIAWGLTLAGDAKGAEQTGNLIYFLLWFDAILYGKDLWKT